MILSINEYIAFLSSLRSRYKGNKNVSKFLNDFRSNLERIKQELRQETWEFNENVSPSDGICFRETSRMLHEKMVENYQSSINKIIHSRVGYAIGLPNIKLDEFKINKSLI